MVSLGVLLGKLLLTLVLIILITVVLSIAAAVIAVLKSPELMQQLQKIGSDPFFERAALWAQILGFIAGSLAGYGLFERRKGWALGLHSRRLWPELGKGAIIGLALITASCGLIWGFGGVRITSFQWNETIGIECLWGLFMFTGVAINEELFARGYVQGLIKHRFGAKTGVVSSALLFALLHAFNPGIWHTPLPLMNLLLAGFLFGVCREVSGNLWMPIGLHLSWNFFQGSIYGFLVSGTRVESVFRVEQSGSTILSGGSFGAEGSLITSVILVLGILFVYNYYDRWQKGRTYGTLRSRFS